MTGCESPQGLCNCCVKAALVGGKETKRSGGIVPPSQFAASSSSSPIWFHGLLGDSATLAP